MTNPQSRVNRRMQEMNIYYKGIDILKMSKVCTAGQDERDGIDVGCAVSFMPRSVFLLGAHFSTFPYHQL